MKKKYINHLAMSSQEIYSLIKKNDIKGLKKLIQNAPFTSSKEFVLPLLKINDPLSVINALSPLCIEYTFGKNCEFGIELSKACLFYTKEVYEQQNGDLPLMLMTVSRFLLNTVNGLNSLGRFEETADLVNDNIEFFTARNAVENMSSILLAKVLALLNLNKIDQARKLITSMDKDKIEWEAQIEYERLSRNINKLLEKAIETEKSKTKEKNLNPFSETIQEGKDLYRILDIGTSLLAGTGKEMNQWKADKISRDATKIFLGKPTPLEISESLQQLLVLREWTKVQGTRSSDSDVLWGLYLCYSRLGKYSNAADVLLDMQKNHEWLRSQIKNPIERAGVYSNYPFFFEALCKVLTLSNRTSDLLNAIESSKGRAIADILTQKSDCIVADYEISSMAKDLPALCIKHKFHYLTYFVDDEEVYAVLVTMDGKLYHSGIIKINKQILWKATHYANPRNWGQVLFINGKKSEVSPSSEILTPLVSWMEPLVNNEILKVNDHICYSPDENIFNLPLHYLKFMGKELFEIFSVSRIHGSFSLFSTFNRNQKRPEKYISFIVPTQQDKDDESPSGVYKGLIKTEKILAEILKGKTYLETEATKEALFEADTPNKLIHFGTHGIFPEGLEHREQNPFRGSGLLFSKGNKLPDKDKIAKGLDQELLLTPENIFNSEINLTNSHVTLQACVSGLSTVGKGRDALGLEWAMLQAGAESVLSTHWNVESIHSFQFLSKFYRYWLQEKISKAEAWRRSVKELKDETSNLFAYNAYSLTGNWE